MAEYAEFPSERDLLDLARVAKRFLPGAPRALQGPRPHARRAGGGSEFLEYRDLHPGDDLRHLDWRASARSSVPQIRRMRDERAGEWVLCLDRSASMGRPDAAKWSLGRRLILGLAFVALQLELRVSLLVFSSGLDVWCPPARGLPAYVRMARLLATLGPVPQGGDSRLEACLGHIPRGAGVVVASDLLRADAMIPTLDLLARQGGRLDLLHLFDRRDVALPDSAPRVLEDVETGATLRFAPGAVDPAAPARRHAAWLAHLEAESRRRGILRLGCPVGGDWRDLVLQLLQGGARAPRAGAAA